MQTETSKKPREGFTMIPNALIDNPNLCIRDKMVLIKLARHGYGKTIVYPSQTRIARDLGNRRETVKAALDSLTSLGPIRPHGKGRKGKREVFTIDLQCAANLTTQSSPSLTDNPSSNLTTQSATPDDSAVIKHKHKEDQENKKNPEPDVMTPDTAERGDIHGKAAYGKCYAKEEPDDSVVRFNKRQINDQLLTPSGWLSDVDGLESDLHAVLALAQSPTYFNSRELDKLVAEHGAEFCSFWASWLLRKIAAEYEADRPVMNPAGLFAEAVRGHWTVDPKWPQFDEMRHTEAARKVSRAESATAGNNDYFECPF